MTGIRIVSRKGGVELLKNRFNCSDSDVSRALRFNVNSYLARCVRSFAVNHLRFPVIAYKIQ